MSKKIKKIIYYLIIISMFLIADKIIYNIPFKNKDCVINNVLELENNSLKEQIKELSSINYHDYDYEIGKITFNNLYNSNSYFIESSSNLNDKIVLNDKGMIGILNNHMLTLVSDLNLSVKVGDNLGILKNNQINIVHGDYKVHDEIYTSGLTGINDNFLIGYVKEVRNNSLDDTILIDYIHIDTSYVVILK